MKNTISTALLVSSLTLWTNNAIAWEKNTIDAPRLESWIPTLVVTTKEKIVDIFNTNLWADTPEEEKQKIRAIFLKEIGHELSEEEIEKFTQILQDKKTQDELYPLLKDKKTWAIWNIVLALLLGIGYGYAYRSQITWQLKRKERINSRAFAAFWSISGMMVLVNGITPGSSVYFMSFILAFLSVIVDKKNEKDGVLIEDSPFEKLSQNISLPVVRYHKDGFPVIWNKKMEEETGYTHKEIVAYYNEIKPTVPPEEYPFIIMKLLYKGENLVKVLEYLAKKKETGEGYVNVTFTMDTKFGEKTFIWSTFPDGTEGDIRIAKPLIDIWEIHIELEKTQALLRRDALTGAYNRRALEEDIQKLFLTQLHQKRKPHPPRNIVMVMMDIDNFKTLNDSYGHELGDAVLKNITAFVEWSLRDTDKFYRLWWDEFVFLLESDDFDGAVRKLNKIRHDFFTQKIITEQEETVSWIGSSWGAIEFNTGSYAQVSDIDVLIKGFYSQIDEYMYAVKYYKLIKDELIAKGKIGEDHLEKNGIGKPVYDSEKNIIGVEVLNEYGSFTLTQEEVKTINEKKRDPDATRRK